MKKLFEEFLREQGYYEVFCNSVLKFYNCSFQHYCRENEIRKYCLPLNRSPLLTGSKVIAINQKWVKTWEKRKKEVLYNFICSNGCLFQFMEALPRGKTFDSLVGENRLSQVFFNIKRPQDSQGYWNAINKKWRKYLKEKVFNYY